MNLWPDEQVTLTTGPLELKEWRSALSLYWLSALEYTGALEYSRFHYLFSPLLCGSSIRNRVFTKLEVTLLSLFSFPSDVPGHIFARFFCSSGNRSTHLAQISLGCRCFFKIVWLLPPDIPVLILKSSTDSRSSFPITAFTAGMFALVTDVPRGISSLTVNLPALKILTSFKKI